MVGLRTPYGLDGLERSATPATPDSGRRLLYPKSDGWYEKNAAGIEARIGGLTTVASLRSHMNATGGGTITVNTSNEISWTTRFIIISNGRGTHFSTGGHFNIAQPVSGTVITGVGGSANATVTAGGVPLDQAWKALYYILPIGGGEVTLNANFRVVQYTSNLEIPDNWVLIAVRGENGAFRFINGVTLTAGQSYNNTDDRSNLVNTDKTQTITGAKTFNSLVGTFTAPPTLNWWTGQLVSTQLTAVSMRLFHDRLRFSTPTYETSTDGTTWTAGTAAQAGTPLAGRSDGNTTIPAASYGRWTWSPPVGTSGFEAWTQIQRLLLKFGYASPTPTATVNVWTSVDGVAWTARVTNWSITAASANQWHTAFSDPGGDTYLRLQIQNTHATAGINVNGIEFQTPRWGDQGSSPHREMPYHWTYDRIMGFYNTIRPMTDAVYDLGSTSQRWRDGHFSGTVNGNGSGLTNLNGSNIGSGTVPVARLGSSGTRDSTTFLRGDNTWAAVSGGGAHAASHGDGGTDEVALDGSQITTGVVPSARLAGSGSSIDPTRFLRATPGTTADWSQVAWEDVTAKPTTFAPSAHTHTAADVSGMKVVTSTTRPATPTTGDLIWETDLEVARVWDGAGWRVVGFRPRNVRICRLNNLTLEPGTITSVVMGTTTYQSHSGMGNGSDITIPIAGKWNVQASLGYDTHTTGRRTTRLITSGTLIQVNTAAPVSGTATHVPGHGTDWDFAAGQVVTTQAFQNSGGQLSLLGGEHSVWMSAHLIAPAEVGGS